MGISDQKNPATKLIENHKVLSLTAVANINESMKQIVKASNKLYVISLNAMFASRATSRKDSGFVEVTALLRDFSQRLEIQIMAITKEINTLVNHSALLSKQKRMCLLLTAALNNAQYENIPESVSLQVQNINTEVEAFLTNFSRLLARCEKLMNIGENLAVLAKVEAEVSDTEERKLKPTTHDMSETIDSIGNLLKKSQIILAA